MRTSAITICIAGAAALAAVGLAVPASAHGLFKVNVCSLIPSKALSGADLDAGCVQLPTTHGRNYIAVYTGNWGKQIVIGGADHFLGFQVIKPTSAYLARAKQALPRMAAEPNFKMSHGVVESVTDYSYGKKEGFSGFATRIVNGYICNVTLFDRSETDPPTKSDVESTLFLIAQFCNKVK